MRFLKKFESFTGDDTTLTIKSNGVIKVGNSNNIDNTIYNSKWENQLPENITINYHNRFFKFKKNNIMIHSDMIQITYSSISNDNKQGEIWGSPDTLEFDIYFAKENAKIRLNIDITYGDLMACEFSVLEPNIVKLIQYTSKGSKFDPSNTTFSLKSESLDMFIQFLNKFNGLDLRKEDLYFLSE